MKFKDILIILMILFLGLLFFSDKGDKKENEHQIKQESKKVEKSKVIIDKNLSKIEQFLKYSESEDLNIFNKNDYDINLSVAPYLLMQRSEDSRIPSHLFAGDAEVNRNIESFKELEDIDLIDFSYIEPPKGSYSSWSRCKIKKKKENASMAKWVLCRWVYAEKTRKISKTAEDNLWNLFKRRSSSIIYTKKNFRKFMNNLSLKIEKDNPKDVVDVDVYKTPYRKEKIGKKSGRIYQGNIIVLDYDKKTNMCKIMFDILKDTQGWIKCNQIDFGI